MRPSSQPTWGISEKVNLPNCTAGQGQGIPTSIVVKDRKSSAKVLPYNNHTIKVINRTWNDVDGSNDLFTIGSCSA